MTLSIAMAVYNCARYLSEQLDSIALQQRMPDELVISDNCSSDDTLRIIARFASSVPFPVHTHVQGANVGVGQNFAHAISLCHGDVICLADCDDVWYPKKLQRIEEVFRLSPAAGLLFSDADLVDDNLNSIGYTLHESCDCVQDGLVTLRAGRDAVTALIPRGFAMFGNTMAFRQAFTTYCLPLPTSWALYRGFHDIWLAVLIASVADIVILPDRLLAYRQHNGQWGGSPLKTPLSTQLRRLLEPCDPRAAIVAQLLVERLSSSHDRERTVAVDDALILLNAWSRHLSAREELPKERVRRVPGIWREVVSGRYRMFSENLLSAVKDLIKRVEPCRNV